MPCGECTTSGWNCTPQILRVVVLDDRHGRIGRAGRGPEPRRRLGDRVEVAHPHVVSIWNIRVQHRRVGGAGEVGTPVLAAHAATDGATQLLGDQLGAVADAEDRHAEVVDRRIELRRALHVDALRAAGQDDRCRVFGGHLGGVQAVRDDLGVDAQLAHPARDQLRVLGAEIDDEDGLAVLGSDQVGSGFDARVQATDGRQARCCCTRSSSVW